MEEISHPKHLEDLLRDHGFSKREAMLLVSGGWKYYYNNRKQHCALKRGRVYLLLRKIRLIRD